MKIIFLDIDGVLNTERYIVYAIENNIPVHDKDGWHIFDEKCVEYLDRIIKETGAKIVISSTWRFNGIEKLRKVWEDRNLPGEIVDVTLSKESSRIDEQKQIYREIYGELTLDRNRGREIDIYLRVHPEISNYVILDDDNDMLEGQNFVQTDLINGIEEKHCEEAIKILNR